MSVKPILFSGPMVRALLEGRKTQTRRVLKPQPSCDAIEPHRVHSNEFIPWRDGEALASIVTPCAPGDLLWVREAHALVPSSAFRMSEGVMQAVDPSDRDRACVYRERWERCAPRWRPSIFMPRWASRLTLRVTDVRVQRVQEITEVDAKAEGVDAVTMDDVPRQAAMSRRSDFASLWDSLNAKRGFGWDANPWVAAYTFEVIRQNVEEVAA
ncbi:hypothetical protein JF540_12830 [Salipiger thiooxidans]|uniref:hypothetical protein n=1 Tax=Salipiger thiooxidans TaxID=282683 RepID=UPI001A8DBC20|nr:hypothetical protein [Salipiger thiooxidans]MBN8187575.1 hypothetical protein [Salipiger thiooxidans]